MTVKAHQTRRAIAAATRHGGIIDYAPDHSSTWFNELYPHLRDVDVGQRTLERRIHDYLKRRPGKTLTEIVTALGWDRGKVERRINEHSTMFQRQGKRWFVREG